MLLGRVYRIFLRYAEIWLRLETPGPELCDASGGRIGAVRSIALDHNRLRVEGWAAADSVGLVLGRNRTWSIPRPQNPQQAGPLFTLELPFEAVPPKLVLRHGTEEREIGLPAFSVWALRRARVRLAARYVADLVALLPTIRRWKLGGDLGAREIVKERLGIAPRSDVMPLDPVVFRPDDFVVPARPYTSVTVLMPVYNAFELTVEALGRVTRNTDLHWHLIVVEDCSTDPRVRPWLQELARDPAHAGRVTLILNDTNLGFIGSVNKGFSAALAHPEGPVVLLNSDALVPEGWASRLLAPLADPDVASVTPMANDAEIFTVPVICARNALPKGMADLLDHAARRLNPAALTCAPTGVGFCMALSPGFLRRIPRFDTSFGRGYGEETDWCQKARALGGVHVVTPNLFVEHRGGESFGSVAKQKLLERNCAEIARRYPGYDAEVQDFIRSDPMASARLYLALVWAGASQMQAVPVYVAHSMGGGADHYLKARIAEDTALGGSAVVLRVGHMQRWRIELHCARGVTAAATDDTDLMVALLSELPRRRIIYSCGVGDRDPLGLPGVLLRLAAGGQPVEMLFHDFFPLSPSYTLLGADGAYHGVPLPGTPAGEDPAHRLGDPGRTIPLVAWQAAWGALAAACERIEVFSRDSRDIVRAVWPGVASRIAVVPHRLPDPVPAIPSGWDGSGPPVIGILGNIGLQKGAAVIQAWSRELAHSDAARLVIIGNVDPELPPDRRAIVHGNYELADLPGLVARYKIAGWLMPSIWPETFSYTTHEILATELPVFCFDIGAQAEAVRRAIATGARGAILPLPGSGTPFPIAEIVAHLTWNPGHERAVARGAR